MLKETKAVFAKFAAIISLCAVLTFNFSPEVAFANSGTSSAERINCGDEDCTDDVYNETVATYESDNLVEASQQSASKHLPNINVVLQATDNIDFTTYATKMQHIFEHDHAVGPVKDKSGNKFDHDESKFVVLERGTYEHSTSGTVEYIVLGEKSRKNDKAMYDAVAEKSAANLEKQTKIAKLAEAKAAHEKTKQTYSSAVKKQTAKATYAQAIREAHPEIHEKAMYSRAVKSNDPAIINKEIKRLDVQLIAATGEQKTLINNKIKDLKEHKAELGRQLDAETQAAKAVSSRTKQVGHQDISKKWYDPKLMIEDSNNVLGGE